MKLSKFMAVFLAAICCLVFVNSSQAKETVTIRGSHALYWTLKDYIPTIEKAADITMDFSKAGGCGDAKKAVKSKQASGAICCPFTDEELAGLGATQHPLALGTLMILVNKDNPIDNLTAAQTRDIFAGKITNWSEVGGENKPIAVLARHHCGPHSVPWKTIIPAEQWVKKRIKIDNTVAMLKTVAAMKNSIGHLDVTLYDPAKVKALKIDGVSPIDKTAFADGYPFFEVISIITPGEPTAGQQRLIDYLRTEKTRPMYEARHLTMGTRLAP
ncbi:substrate-binding domain-containing protein [Thermodesulfobacteriota bacterium]